MPVSEKTYLQLALEDPNQWELHCGHLRRKPATTAKHNHIGFELAYVLRQQLDVHHFHVRYNAGHLRRTSENHGHSALSILVQNASVLFNTSCQIA